MFPVRIGICGCQIRIRILGLNLRVNIDLSSSMGRSYRTRTLINSGGVRDAAPMSLLVRDVYSLEQNLPRPRFPSGYLQKTM